MDALNRARHTVYSVQCAHQRLSTIEGARGRKNCPCTGSKCRLKHRESTAGSKKDRAANKTFAPCAQTVDCPCRLTKSGKSCTFTHPAFRPLLLSSRHRRLLMESSEVFVGRAILDWKRKDRMMWQNQCSLRIISK